jgi:hypothetical protein
VSGQVWDLQQFRERLGQPAFDKLWDEMMQLTALSLGAAVRSLHDADAWLGPSIPDYGFQMVGLGPGAGPGQGMLGCGGAWAAPCRASGAPSRPAASARPPRPGLSHRLARLLTPAPAPRTPL